MATQLVMKHYSKMMLNSKIYNISGNLKKVNFGNSDNVAWALEGIFHGIVDADTGFVKQSLSSDDKMIKILEQHNFKKGDAGTGSSSDGDEENDDALPSLKRRKGWTWVMVI